MIFEITEKGITATAYTVWEKTAFGHVHCSGDQKSNIRHMRPAMTWRGIIEVIYHRHQCWNPVRRDGRVTDGIEPSWAHLKHPTHSGIARHEEESLAGFFKSEFIFKIGPLSWTD